MSALSPKIANLARREAGIPDLPSKYYVFNVGDQIKVPSLERSEIVAHMTQKAKRIRTNSLNFALSSLQRVTFMRTFVHFEVKW